MRVIIRVIHRQIRDLFAKFDGVTGGVIDGVIGGVIGGVNPHEIRDGSRRIPPV